MGEHNEADERASLDYHYLMDHVPEDAKSRHARRRDTRRNIINRAKNVACLDCGQHYPPYVMDFDHVRGEKLGDISYLVSASIRIDKLFEEIAKCDVVCANCHRIRTYRQRLDTPSQV